MKASVTYGDDEQSEIMILMQILVMIMIERSGVVHQQYDVFNGAVTRHLTEKKTCI